MNAIISSPYLDTQDQPPIPQRDASEGTIVIVLCQAFRVTREELRSKAKHRRLAEARQVGYWLLRTRTLMSLPEIGRVLNRDHTTVLVGVRAAVRRRAMDEAFMRFTDELAAAVEARVA